MSDLFHEDVPVEFIQRAFAVMNETPQHTYQVLTKRSRRLVAVADRLPWPPNLWMGVSIESDKYAFRARHLADVPAAIRFLSCEPLLGPLPSLDLNDIDWVIIGGESGKNARRLELAWVRDLILRCAEAEVAAFVKQLGSAWSVDAGHGRTHGGEWELWPGDVRLRQMPLNVADLVR